MTKETIYTDEEAYIHVSCKLRATRESTSGFTLGGEP
jgi:hypothetical protein